MMDLMFQRGDLLFEFFDEFDSAIADRVMARALGPSGVLRLVFGRGASRVAYPFGMRFGREPDSKAIRIRFRHLGPKKENLRRVINPEQNQYERAGRTVS